MITFPVKDGIIVIVSVILTIVVSDLLLRAVLLAISRKSIMSGCSGLITIRVYPMPG